MAPLAQATGSNRAMKVSCRPRLVKNLVGGQPHEVGMSGLSILTQYGQTGF
jgi:hypothetical protein